MMNKEDKNTKKFQLTKNKAKKVTMTRRQHKDNNDNYANIDNNDNEDKKTMMTRMRKNEWSYPPKAYTVKICL